MATIYSKSGADAATAAAIDALNLGTAATTDADEYATAAQGALADSAVQPGDLGTAAAADAGDFAAAAQGAKADASDVDQITLTGDLVLTLPVGHPAGQVYRAAITQDGVGGHTVTYGGAPVTVDTTAGAETLVEVWPGGRVVYPGAAGGGGGGDTFGEGVVPIFETLAQAEAWEAANPGRIALTLEAAAEPDITPPSAGTLTMSQLGGTYMEATVSGASDDRGFVEYAFSRDNGAAWTGWQASPAYMWTGLALSSSHTVTHRVRDQAGNTVAGVTLPVTTLAADPEPQWGTRWHDDFTGDGPLVGRTMDAGDGVWQLLPGVTDPGWATTGGALPRTPEATLANIVAIGLRGAGAMVTLPGTGVSRMRITVEGGTSSGWGAIGFFFIDPSGTARFWLPRTHLSTQDPATGTYRLPGIRPGGPLLTAETMGGAPVITNAERVFDITPAQFTETIDGTLNVAVPLSGQYDFSQINQWGVYIARVSNNGVTGNIGAVTFRWE